MHEIAPGLHHWTTTHERWGIDVSSYLLAPEGIVIDPRVPASGIESVAALATPTVLLLTNRHHYRHADAFVTRFGARVWCNAAGLHELPAHAPVTPFAPGDVLPGHVVALGIGAICPDETALFSPRHRAVALADCAVRMPSDGPLGFVPDVLMDDPPATKAGIVAALTALLDLDFDHLLLAHGDPIVGDGKRALATFLSAHGERDA